MQNILIMIKCSKQGSEGPPILTNSSLYRMNDGSPFVRNFTYFRSYSQFGRKVHHAYIIEEAIYFLHQEEKGVVPSRDGGGNYVSYNNLVK